MTIVLSIRQFFRLAHALNHQLRFTRFSQTRIQCYFFISDIVISTRVITIASAKHWCPLIMGEHFYRYSFLSTL